MKTDIDSRTDVEMLISRFYDLALKDNLLAPAFDGLNMQQHLPIMYRFWSSLLLDEHSYTGNAFDKHLHLHLSSEMFDRWLKIFRENAHSLFEGEKTELAIQRAESIAYIFQTKLKEIGKLNG